MKIIEHDIAGGKTIKALEFLHSQGGGIYIGTGETEAMVAMLCKRHGFENIRAVVLPADTAVAIDNEDRLNLAITRTKRKK